MTFDKLRVALTMFFVFASTIGWLAIITQPIGWLKKVTTLYSIDASLWKVTVSEGVASMGIGGMVGLLSPEATEALTNMHRGSFSIQEFREYMCQFPKIALLSTLCPVWGSIQTATWIFLLMMCPSLLTYIVGACLDVYHHYVFTRTKLRKVVKLLYVLSPVLFIFALTLYCIMASRLSDMPPNSEAHDLGPCVTIAWCLCVVSFMPLMVNHVLGRMTMKEELNEHVSAQKRFLRDVGFPGQYGTMQGREFAGAAPSQQGVGGWSPEDSPPGQMGHMFGGCGRDYWQGGPDAGGGGCSGLWAQAGHTELLLQQAHFPADHSMVPMPPSQPQQQHYGAPPAHLTPQSAAGGYQADFGGQRPAW